jgi:hypothetical protein
MLMKMTSKRRRTKQEILDEKFQELKKKSEIDKKLKDYDSMLQALQVAEQKAQANQVASDSIDQMMVDGIIQVDDQNNFVHGHPRSSLENNE